MTKILGKDAPLATSIERMSKQLTNLGLTLEEVSWLNPVPNAWSVHLRDRFCPLLFTNGKGATREAALASALGEFIERLSTNHFFADYYLGRDVAASPFVHYPNEKWFKTNGNALPAELLDAPTLDHYTLKGQLTPSDLIERNLGDERRGICAIPFVRQRTSEQVWFPINILENLYVSNGMAAGNTLWEARVQALSEIFERHIKNTIITSGISLPEIPAEVVSAYPKVQAAIDALEAAGYNLIVQDASLAGKFPLVNITVLSPQTGGCYASFGAHPKFEVALERAVTELLQGRPLEALGDFSGPSFDMQEATDPMNLEAHFIDSSGIVAWEFLSSKPDYAFTQWNIEGDTKAEFEDLCARIHRVDMDIYIADFQHLGTYACRIVVPGMSEVYPVEDLLWNNNNAGVSYRDVCLSLPELNTSECQVLLDDLEDDININDAQPLSEFIGIAPDKGTPWESMRIGELKGLLALRVGDLSLALLWVEWSLGYGSSDVSRIALFRCLQQLLTFELDLEKDLVEYRSALRKLHRSDVFDRACHMIAGEQVFDDVPCDDGKLNHFAAHTKLLAVYERLQAKKSYE